MRSVTLWVGDRGTVTDLSRGGGPDFRIDYHDGRVAFGEVGWHQDPVLQAMWGEAFKHPRPQRIDLPSGLGQWGMGLVRGAHIKSLYAEIPDFVASLVAKGEFLLRVQDDWPRGEPADTARRLGIQYLARASEEEPAEVLFLFGASAGFVLPDANVVTDWVESVLLSDHDYHDTTAKLLGLRADERHVYLMSGGRTDPGVDERLRRFDQAVPTRRPTVPLGITHVWVVPQFGLPGAPGGLCSVKEGWSPQALPAEDP